MGDRARLPKPPIVLDHLVEDGEAIRDLAKAHGPYWQPGRMLVIDTDEGRIIGDEEIKRDLASRWPYRRWLKKNVADIAATADRRVRLQDGRIVEDTRGSRAGVAA